MTTLDDIPTTAAPPPDARPSEIVARLRAMRPSRRTVLRGLLVAAAAAALVPLDWYLTRRDAVAAPRGAEADSRSEYLTCQPASYDERANNWPAEGPAVCYGGWRRGSYPCSNGFHREGSYEGNGEQYESNRLATNCEGRNAWRWNGWRCSDGLTDITFPDGETYHGITIAACQITADDRGANTGGSEGTGGRNQAPAPAATPAPAPAATPAPATSSDPDQSSAPEPEPDDDPVRPLGGLLGMARTSP